MTGKQLYEQHLAQAADGTPLRAAMLRVIGGTATADDLIAHIKWELDECDFSLPPQASDPRYPKADDKDASRVMDAWHASCCAERAHASVRQLERLLAK